MRISRLAAVVGLAFIAATTGLAQQAFKIGQPAPEFKAGRWIKGPAVSKIEPGQIYVLEFWATWCGPCRAAMPHLSETARKLAGKVTVIGVDVHEHGSGEKVERNVDKFIEQMGKDADYANCRDTSDDHLKKNWYEPTKSPGIPTTIVVDQQSRIAWIGHPKDLDRVLDELLTGKFDYEKSAAEHTSKAGKNEAMMKVFREYGDAIKAKDWAKAIAVVDNNSEYANTMWLLRFNALVQLDPKQAFDQARGAVEKKERTANAYLQAIAGADGLPRELYQYAFDTMTQDAQPTSYNSLAKLSARLGDYSKAVDYQSKFKEYAMTRKLTPEIMDKIDEDLAAYQAKK